MSKHTPEPWVVERTHDIDAIAWVGQFAVLPQDHATRVVRGNTENDARRIVACVNACRRFPTDVLEHDGGKDFPGFWGGVAARACRKIDAVTAQRDELLAALEAFTAAQDAKRAAQGKGAGPIAAAIGDLIIAEEKARAAIAKAKGGAA